MPAKKWQGTLVELGAIALYQSDPDGAERLFQESLKMPRGA